MISNSLGKSVNNVDLHAPFQITPFITNPYPSNNQQTLTQKKKKMKRASSSSSSASASASVDLDQDLTGQKKLKSLAVEEEEAQAAADLGEDLVLEVLKRADAKTLARAACASRRWRRMTEDERIWEAVCTRHWASIGCGAQQMRSVVLALGGFRKLHTLCLLPLLQPAHVPRRGFTTLPSSPATSRWGKDEVQLSMALLSIKYFELMNGNKRSGES